MVEEINEVQKLQFELMKKASFNFFDGEKIVGDLQTHRELWKGVVMFRSEYAFDEKDLHTELIDLICLRDIEGGHWNVDTVYILVQEGKENQLEALAKSEEWEADEVSWMSNQKVHKSLGIGSSKDFSKKVLRVWWD